MQANNKRGQVDSKVRSENVPVASDNIFKLF